MVTTASEVKTKETPVIGRRIPLEKIEKTVGFTPRVQKIKQAWMDFTSTVSSDRGWYFMESWKETEGEHESIRIAKGYLKYCQNCRINIDENELLVGGITHWPRGTHPRPEQRPTPLLARLKQQYEPLTTASRAVSVRIEKEDLNRLVEACEYFEAYFKARPETLWGQHDTQLPDGFLRSRPVTEWESARILGLRGMPVEPGGNNTVRGLSIPALLLGCDYEKVLAKGFNGLIEEIKAKIKQIESKRRDEFDVEDVDALHVLNSWIIALEAWIIYAQRHAALAREMAAKEQNAQRKKELLKIADVCEHVPANPARDFHEALQMHWLILVAQEIEKCQSNAAINRFDQYTYAYYMRSINEGIHSRQECAELMGCMFMKWQSLESFTPFGFKMLLPASYLPNATLGGVDMRGKDACNEVTCLVLHVARQVKTNQPHISLRYHRAMAPEALEMAILCTRDHGAGIPAWFNDRVLIEYLQNRGIPQEEARDGTIVGCIDFGHSKGYMWRREGGPSFVNHAKLFEMALNDGMDPFTKTRQGPRTGDPRNFKTYEELENAYLKQVDYYYEYEIGKYRHLTYKDYLEKQAYAPFSSPLNEDCIPRAKDIHKGGMRYFKEFCGGAWIDRALSDAASCLQALTKVVFEEKSATMDEVLKALDADFNGYEKLRKKLMDVTKYGNDDDNADEIMARIWDYSREWCDRYLDYKGFRMCPHRNGNAWAPLNGKVTGALPNGRKAGTSLADAAVSPVQGTDKNGPTAMLNSAAKLDPQNLQAPLLNMRFTPGPLNTREGRHKFAQLLGTYFDKGAAHVQFTVLTRETLQDAKVHPENYRDLVVRVAGYSAFWVELTPEVQDEILTRTQHEF